MKNCIEDYLISKSLTSSRGLDPHIPMLRSRLECQNSSLVRGTWHLFSQFLWGDRWNFSSSRL